MIVIKQRNEAALAVVCRYSGRCGSFYLSETTVLHSDVQITFNDILAHINVLIAGHQDCVLYLHMYARMVYACTHYRSLSSLLLQLTSLMRNVKVMALWHELGRAQWQQQQRYKRQAATKFESIFGGQQTLPQRCRLVKNYAYTHTKMQIKCSRTLR